MPAGREQDAIVVGNVDEPVDDIAHPTQNPAAEGIAKGAVTNLKYPIGDLLSVLDPVALQALALVVINHPAGIGLRGTVLVDRAIPVGVSLPANLGK